MKEKKSQLSDAELLEYIKLTEKLKHPREAFERLCNMFGIKDMDINRIEIVATLHELPRVKITHVGIVDNERYETEKQFNLVPIDDGL